MHKYRGYRKLLLVTMFVLLALVFATRPGTQVLEKQSNTNQTQPTISVNDSFAVGVKQTNTVYKLTNNNATKYDGVAWGSYKETLYSTGKNPSNGQLLVTIKASLPEWINSTDPSLIGESLPDVTSPCMRDVLDGFVGENYANRYSLLLPVKTNNSSDLMLPIFYNGILCQSKSFYDFIHTDPVTAIESKYKQLVSSAESTPEESTSEQKIISKKYGVNSPPKMNTLVSKHEPPDQYTSADGKFRLDEIMVPAADKKAIEVVVDKSYAQADITSILLPNYQISLVTAWRELNYLLNPGGFTVNRIVTRSNSAWPLTIERNIRSSSNADKTAIATKNNMNENATKEKFNLLVYSENDPIVRTDRFSLYYPFSGNLLRLNSYLDKFVGDFANRNDPNEAFNDNLYPIIRAFCKQNNPNFKDDSIVNASNCRQADLNFTISLSGLSPKPAVDMFKQILSDNALLMPCSKLDKFNTILQQSNTGEKEKHELGKLLTQKDCYGINGIDKDVLQEYLCAQNLLTKDECGSTGAGTGTETDEECTITNLPSKPVNGDTFHAPALQGARSGYDYTSTHPGIDWGVPIGTPLYALASSCRIMYSGVVSAESEKKLTLWYRFASGGFGYHNEGLGLFGRSILLECPLSDGSFVYPTYAHLSKVVQDFTNLGIYDNSGNLLPEYSGSNDPRPLVPDNLIVGYSGNSGNSGGPHLHFELRRVADVNVYTTNGTNDPNYLDPRCLFTNTCNYQAGDATPGSNTRCTTNLPSGGKFTMPTNTTPPVSGDIPSQLAALIPNCPVQENILNIAKHPDDLNLIKYSMQIGNQQGTVGYEDVFKMATAIAQSTCTPVYKLLAQLDAEHSYQFTDESEYSDTEIKSRLSKLISGRVDQTYNAVPSGNFCGCLGIGNACPGTARTYFAPSGGKYQEVRSCLQSVGVSTTDGQLINPSYISSSLCMAAVKLRYDSGSPVGECKNWTQTCDAGCATRTTSDLRTTRDCPYYRAAAYYFGSCGDPTTSNSIRAYCNRTSDVCDPNSLISRYKSMSETGKL